MKKFDKCNRYETVKLPKASPAKLYALNRQRIEKEQIEAPTMLIRTKGSKPVEVRQVVSHSFFHKLKLITPNVSSEKKVSDYALKFETFDNGKPNIYYKQNQSTKLKELIEMTSAAVKEYEAVAK
ncbi:hypothetical protein [Pontibacter sp. 172403-2]|uniref:hypothetical protein n=1 Tax=Pontibacter rufus TaxID=2791028 RepID=UPI0018AFBB47|nr:hypothetical protein [Pontibacter sp. 172403-2]